MKLCLAGVETAQKSCILCCYLKCTWAIVASQVIFTPEMSSPLEVSFSAHHISLQDEKTSFVVQKLILFNRASGSGGLLFSLKGHIGVQFLDEWAGQVVPGNYQ